jgi:hypothetical protein
VWLAGAIAMGAGVVARPVAAQQAGPAAREITVYKSPT